MRLAKIDICIHSISLTKEDVRKLETDLVTLKYWGVKLKSNGECFESLNTQLSAKSHLELNFHQQKCRSFALQFKITA
jgi:hypothetical protein